MGLDMYLEGRTFNWTLRDDNPETRDGFRVKGVTLELGYWRKHPDLHGYIVQKFANGVDECQDIPLTAENMIDIIAAVKEKRLPHTTGFFFGESDSSRDPETIDIFMKAIAWVEGQPHIEPYSKPTPLGDSGLLTIRSVNLEAIKDMGKESRDVVYRASW